MAPKHTSKKTTQVKVNDCVGKSTDCRAIIDSGPPWNSFLSIPDNLQYVAPVTHFPHAPLAGIWDQFSVASVGKVVELPNPYVEAETGVRIMWVATVQCFAGYKAKVEFETFGKEPRHLAWISFCSSLPKQLGFSIRHQILLYPMLDVAAAIPNYFEKLVEKLDEYRTIREDHGAYLKEKLKGSQRYPLRSKVEVLDRSYISRVRMGTVTAQIGDLIHITYDIAPVPNDEGFVFSVYSDSVHPLGWAKEVGVEIFDHIEPKSAIPFPTESLPQFPANIILEVGQYLEARHPLDPYCLSTAVVDAVLNHGYFMAAFRTTTGERKKPTRYCFHITSPYIFPVGFCHRHGIPHRRIQQMLSPSLAPLHLRPPRPKHPFTPGLKFEAMDINDPGYIGPVTVAKVVEHLLFLQYDGWAPEDPSSFIWVSADSTNIFPLGYAELIGYKFQNYPAQPEVKK